MGTGTARYPKLGPAMIDRTSNTRSNQTCISRQGQDYRRVPLMNIDIAEVSIPRAAEHSEPNADFLSNKHNRTATSISSNKNE